MGDFTLEDAILLATHAHKGQIDKVGEPYILHPLRVMFTFPPYRPQQRMVAVMHDVLEDTAVTAEDLLRTGCDPNIVQSVVALTYTDGMRAEGFSYHDFITQSVLPNEIARDVKIADIRDNSSMERLLRLDRDTQDRLLKKYNRALDILEAPRA